MPSVVDASATLPWCFPGEATVSTEAPLDRVAVDEQIIVPAHWLTEVSNSLRMAMPRKRIDIQAERFLGQLAALRITFELPLSMSQAQVIFALRIVARGMDLTSYESD